MASLFTTKIALFVRTRMQVRAIKSALRNADRAEKKIEKASSAGDLSEITSEFIKKSNALLEAIGHLSQMMHDGNLVLHSMILPKVNNAATFNKLRQEGLSKDDITQLISLDRKVHDALAKFFDDQIDEVQRIRTGVRKAA